MSYINLLSCNDSEHCCTNSQVTFGTGQGDSHEQSSVLPEAFGSAFSLLSLNLT